MKKLQLMIGDTCIWCEGILETYTCDKDNTIVLSCPLCNTIYGKGKQK